MKYRIRLSDIPEDGKEFHLTRETKELNGILQDLIQDEDYDIKFQIRPINNRDYLLTGTLKTRSPQDCSLCGLDFKFPVVAQLHEILIPPQPQHRTGQYARVNHVSDAGNQGPGSLEYDEDLHFNVGEYAHEAIALEIPFNAKPEADPKGNCKICGLNMETHNFGYDEPMSKDEPHNPFAALKNLKL